MIWQGKGIFYTTTVCVECLNQIIYSFFLRQTLYRFIESQTKKAIDSLSAITISYAIQGHTLSSKFDLRPGFEDEDIHDIFVQLTPELRKLVNQFFVKRQLKAGKYDGRPILINPFMPE